LYVVYLAVFPFPIPEYKNVPFPVKTKEVHPGDYVTYTISYCRDDSMPAAVIGRELINDVVITLPEITSKFNPGCNVVDVTRDQIPMFAPPGTYKIRLIISFHVNQLQHRVIVVETEEFTVLPKE
jgi:hypothetical protein